MPRETDGTYTLPTGTVTPAVTGTAISSVDFNALVDDIAATLQDSLSRTGDGGMEVPLKFAGGTDAAPGITFDGDTDTGIFSDVANELAITAGGAESARFTATGVVIPGTLDVDDVLYANATSEFTGAATFTAKPVLSAGITGILIGDLPTGALDSTAVNAAGALSSTALAELPGVAVTLTTSGRPVLVSFNASGVSLTADAGGVRTAEMNLQRSDDAGVTWAAISAGAEGPGKTYVSAPASTTIHCSGFTVVDTAAAGAHTWRIVYKVSNAAAGLYMSTLAAITAVEL